MNQSRKSERIYCNQCRGKTVHRLRKIVKDAGTDDETGFQWHTTFEMLQCAGCQDVVLRRTFAFSENQEVEVRYFPPAMSRYLPTWRYSLSKGMRLLLEEVYRSLDSENLRLPMMGARTLVDMLFFEQLKKDVGNFKQKLETLEKEGIVSPQNREVLDAALDAGSAAAHRGHEAGEYEIRAVMDIVENMLQSVYVLPKMAKNLRELTLPRKPKKSGS